MLVAKAARRISPRRVMVTLDHGVKRQIRIMFEALGWQVVRLARVRIGTLADPAMPPGTWRRLRAADLAAPRPPASRPSPTGGWPGTWA